MVSKKTGAMMAANAYNHHHHHHSQDGRPSLPPTPVPLGHSPTLQPTNQIHHHHQGHHSPSYPQHSYSGMEHSVKPYQPSDFSYIPGKHEQDWAGYRGFEYDRLGRAELIGVMTKEVPRPQRPGSWFEDREDGRSDLPPVEVIVHEVRGDLPPITESEAYLPELQMPEPEPMPVYRQPAIRRIDVEPQRHIPTYSLPLRRATDEVILPVQHLGPIDYQPVPASPIFRGRDSGYRSGYTVPEGRRTYGVPISHRPSTPPAAPAPAPVPAAPAPKPQTYEDVQQY